MKKMTTELKMADLQVVTGGRWFAVKATAMSGTTLYGRESSWSGKTG